ncbi:Ubiquitin carboxyl-terminal hydrolase 14, partial [Dictyocoela roeselum]
ESKKLTQSQIKQIEFQIVIDDYQECPHQSTFDIDLVHKNESCGCDVEWVCISCGYKGCSRPSYYNKCKGHSLQHYKETRHPVVIKINENLVYCYECDMYVSINNYYTLRNKLEIGDPDGNLNKETVKGLESSDMNDNDGSNNENIKNYTENYKKDAMENTSGSTNHDKNLGYEISNTKTNYVGIKNIGNTCYISSVLHFIGSIIIKEPIDLQLHFNMCPELPHTCFCCQFFKFLVCLKNNDRQEIINIEQLIRIIENEFGFVRNCQHDACEFFCLLLSKIDEYERLSLIPKITNLFYMETKRGRNCKCNSNNTFEKTPFLIVPVMADIADSVYSYFKGNELDCRCGQTEAVRIVQLPKYLIIVLKRVVTSRDKENKNNGNENKINGCRNVDHNEYEIVKINDKVRIERLNLGSLYDPIVPRDSAIDELTNLGFSKEDAFQALKKSLNDGNVAAEYLFNGEDLHLRENVEYNYFCSVVHIGDNCMSGHYVFHMSKEFFGECLTISDTKLFKGDITADSYIICFK